MPKIPAISVVISTYNAEAWLEKVLYGFQYQDFKDFELVVADDGSRQATKDLIEQMRSVVSYPIVHVWQEDDGFQKSRILNKAVIASKAPYIVMTDGDCIPRKDFLSVHAAHMEPGYFLSGGYFMLPMNISKVITKEDIAHGNCFNISWLKNLGLKNSFKNNKLRASGNVANFLNAVTPTNASWNGHNASGYKSDIVKVNGFDERMQYGGQDRELGERLFNLGLKSKQLRYSAVVVHLDHKRGYKNQASIDKNRSIRDRVKAEKLCFTPFGIQQKA